MSILVVDDNSSKRLALRAVLAPLGHQVVEADSGRAALRCLLAEQFAVILLDVRMPEMNGFETAAIIRQRQQSEFTPIIFITAYSGDELGAAERYADGAVDFLTAPVRPEELRAKVSAFATLFVQAAALASVSRANESRADQWMTLVDLLPVGVFCTDEDGRYTYTNDEWSTMTGIPGPSAVGCVSELLGASPDGDTSSVFELGTRAMTIAPQSGAPCVTYLVSTRPIPAAGRRSAGWVGTVARLSGDAAAAARSTTAAGPP